MHIGTVKTLVVASTLVGLVSACSSSSGTTSSGQDVSKTAGVGDARSLKGVCPDTIVVQDNWTPQAENGSTFQLLGDAKPDKAKKKVRGKLVDDGVDTGVQLEIRAGGLANNFTPPTSVLYTDKSVMLGAVDLDGGAQSSSKQQTLSVFSPLDLSPLVILWDKNKHQDWNTIQDVGQSGAKVLYFSGSTYMDYLTGSGILRKSQLDASYGGNPQDFLAGNTKGAIAQQGFLTNEVYNYPKSILKKPVGYQLVADTGYPNYPSTLAIRADRKGEFAGCLKKLVPALQRSTVAYMKDPSKTNSLIVSLVKTYGLTTYSVDQAAYAVKAMKDNNIIGNGGNKAVGDFDDARVQKLIKIVAPIFAGQRTPVKAGLAPADISTNEFIDPSIGLPS